MSFWGQYEEFEKSWKSQMVIMKVQQLENLTLIILIRKKLPNLLAMNDNKFSKSIKSIAKDMEVSEFLIGQIMYKDIRYFSYKKKKGQFWSQVIYNKRKRPPCKAFKQTQASPPTKYTLLFFRWVNSQNNHWLALSSQNVPILMKTKQPFHIMDFGAVTSDGDVIPPFIFPTWSHTQQGGLH